MITRTIAQRKQGFNQERACFTVCSSGTSGPPYILVTNSLQIILINRLLSQSLTPESLRWLLVKGKMEEAEKLYGRIARMNGKTLPVEGLEIDTATDTQTRLGDFRDLFKTRRLTKTTLISWFCW